MGVIVDTCIWVDVERGRISAADVQQITGTEPVYICPVTIAELTFGAEMAADAAIRQQRLSALERLKKKPALLMDEETGLIFGRLAAQLRRQGRAADFRIQDLWIAALAVQYAFPVLTHNVRDFEDIPGVKILAMPASG